MDPINILIVDDHPLFRKGMTALLETEPDMTVLGAAETGEQAVSMALDLQPDVILMDLHMPEGSGLDATRDIVHTSPHIRVLVVTMFEDDESVFAALRAGARGYILKGADEGDMLRAIRAVSKGEAIFSPSIASRLFTFFDAAKVVVPEDVFPDLTSREREILELIAQGKSNGTIADELTISIKTVQNHVSNIFSKLQVADRAQALIRAREAGLGSNT